jgi:hypothetical protein
MGITLHGPAWPTVAALRLALAGVPEVGEYRLGGPPKDSIAQLTAFREAGLRTPDFTTDLLTATEWVNEQDAIIFGRMLLHTRGNDICLPGRRNSHGQYSRRWRNSQWWSRYVPPMEEWRVHVFDGKSIARGRKVQTGTPWRRAPVRNISNGWTFDFTGTTPRGLRTTAKQALQALGYPAGAVDILQVGTIRPRGLEPPTTPYMVLEVNRVPALTCSYTRDAWVAAIRRHIREKGNQ